MCSTGISLGQSPLLEASGEETASSLVKRGWFQFPAWQAYRDVRDDCMHSAPQLRA